MYHAKKNRHENTLRQIHQEANSKRNYLHSPPDTTTFKLIERHLKRKIKEKLNDEGLKLEYIDDPSVFAVMRKAIRQVVKNLEETLSWFRKEYKRYLIPDKDIFSHTKWIWYSKKISKNLSRKRNSKLIPLMNYLCNHRLGGKESESLVDDIGAAALHPMHTKKGQYVERYLVLVIPDFEDIENKLNMSLSLIRKYLKGMSESEFIKPMRKLGSNEQKVYALGYYVPYSEEGEAKRRPKPNWFLKDTKEMRQALVNFNRPE